MREMRMRELRLRGKKLLELFEPDTVLLRNNPVST